MTNTQRKCLKFGLVMASLLTAAVWRANAAPINPAIAATCSVSSPGQMAWDAANGVMWVSTSNGMAALDSSCATLATVALGSAATSVALDAATGNVWYVSSTAGLVYAFNSTAALGGNPANISMYLGGHPSQIVIDQHTRQAWVLLADTGTVTTIRLGTMSIAGTVSSFNGDPITALCPANTPYAGMFVVSTGPVGFTVASTIAFYLHGTTDAYVFSQNVTSTISPFMQGAYSGYLGTAFWGTDTTFDAAGNNGNVGQFPVTYYYITDGSASWAQHYLSMSVNASDLVLIAVREYAATINGIPNPSLTQVYFTHGNNPAYTGVGHAIPGLTVSGARWTAFGGGYAWASSPASNTVTLMTY